MPAPVQRGSVLSAADAAASDLFGASVALSATAQILAVGANQWEGAAGTDRGGVYIHDLDSSSAWGARGSVIEASDAADSDLFGSGVALSSDGAILAVGAFQWESGATTDRGGVYIYDWSGSSWVQRGSVLTAGDAAASDFFGYSVALSSDGAVLAVGSRSWEGAAADQGGVYIYDWSGSSWVQRGSVLTAGDAAASDFYGASVALSADGSVLAVGATGWEGAAGTGRGGVYIYDWNGSVWTQRGSVIEASDAADSDEYGFSVALSVDGDVLAVGARRWEGASGTDRGSIYLYDRNGSAWTQRGSALEASDAADSDFYGRSVALADNAAVLVVGANNWESGATENIGGVYTYTIQTEFTGAAAGQAIATGSLDTQIQLDADAAGESVAAGSIDTAIQLAGEAAGETSATGNLYAGAELAGTATGQASATGSLDTQIQAAGAASGQATGAGALDTQIQLDADAAGESAATGSLDTQIQTAGAAAGQATASGSLDTQILFDGDAAGQAGGSADLTTIQWISGSASGQAAAAGALTPTPTPARTFILSGLSLTFESHLDLDQDYYDEQASRITRHCDGSARKQTCWRGKLRTRISGQGWIPPGFDLLDYAEPLEMSCIALRAITSGSNVITLPAARRTDRGFEPFAYATVDGGKRDTPLALSGDTATVATVTGAAFYTVCYYPKLTVFADPPTQRHDAIADKYSWDFEAREV
jgi:hypothetical protein